jgi:hypothetical protein
MSDDVNWRFDRHPTCGCHASKAQISYPEIPRSTQDTMNNTNRTIITMTVIMSDKDGR